MEPQKNVFKPQRGATLLGHASGDMHTRKATRQLTMEAPLQNLEGHASRDLDALAVDPAVLFGEE